MRQRGERIGSRFQVKKMMMRVDGFAEPCRLEFRTTRQKLIYFYLYNFVSLVKKIGDRFFFFLIIFSSGIVDSFRIDMVSLQTFFSISSIYYEFLCFL